MAELTTQRTRDARNWADKIIPRLIDEWRELPACMESIESWADEDFDDYAEQWRLRESQRYDLERDAAAGRLTPGQLHRLGELHELVSAHKPLLDALLRRSIN